MPCRPSAGISFAEILRPNSNIDFEGDSAPVINNRTVPVEQLRAEELVKQVDYSSNYGVPFVSKLCLLMGQFSSKNRLSFCNLFAKNQLDFCTL